MEMMRMARSMLFALLVAVLTTAAAPRSVQAQNWYHQLSADIHVGFWRNMCWPKPFVYADRQAAFAPMHVMAANGWRRNNLLGAHHFDRVDRDGSQLQLNMAGRLRVQWILTQAPVHRRNVFVERDLDPEITGRRIEAVQTFAGTFAPEAAANVYDTHLRSEGRPARDVDWTNSQFWANAPVPALPEDTGGPTGAE
jgi:hypothetical protein